jgi:hypothetical protein
VYPQIAHVPLIWNMVDACASSPLGSEAHVAVCMLKVSQLNYRQLHEAVPTLSTEQAACHEDIVCCLGLYLQLSSCHPSMSCMSKPLIVSDITSLQPPVASFNNPPIFPTLRRLPFKFTDQMLAHVDCSHRSGYMESRLL